MPNRTIIQWDKEDIESLGILKIDLLSLGMLSAIKKSILLEILETLQTRPPAVFAGPGFSLS